METSTKSEVGGRKSEWAGAESGAVLQIREFEGEKDFAWLEEWHEGHGGMAPPGALLPKLGIVVFETNGGEQEDVAALWLYMDNSVGVCFVEHVVTRPGLTLAGARGALLFGLTFLKERAMAMNYGLMLVHTRPAIARVLRGAGFREDKRDLVAMWTLTGETNGNGN
ncbi:hypothetical protein BH09VER1_BH09VER1_46280 [soil metagenome]